MKKAEKSQPVAPAVEVPKTPAEIQAVIDQEKASHHQALVAAEEAHKERLLDLLAQHRKATDAQERAIDNAVVTSLRESVATLTADETSKQAESEEHESRVAQLRERVAPKLARGQEVYAQLIAFDQEYGSELRRLQATDRESLYRGLPSEGAEGVQSASLVSHLQKNVSLALTLLDGGKRTIETQRQEIASLVEHGWMRRGKQEFEVALVQALHELGTANDDLIWTLQTLARSVAAGAQRLNAIKAKSAASGELPAPFEFENRGAVVDGLREAEERMKRGHAPKGFPPQPQPWSVFEPRR